MSVRERCQAFLVLGALLLAWPARGQEPIVNFNIPPQGLAQALDALSRQGQVEIMSDGSALKDKQTPGLTGSYTVRQAVEKLLAGSGLAYTFTADNAVAIKVAEAEPPAGEKVSSETEQGATELPEMTVTASPIDDMSYNPPNATTATKTDTPIMETPLNIQVIPRQVLRDQQVVRINKALQNVSGVYAPSMDFSGFQSIGTMRGFSAAQYYVEGVRVISHLDGSASQETADLERIEVLKGPGSVLYGRVEPGGIVNVVRKKPLAQPYYALEQQFGSFDFYRTTVDATGPLTKDDTLLYRMNLAYENAGSFREFREDERVFLAPALRWNISPRTQADFYLEYLHNRETFDVGLVALGNRPAPVPRERSHGEGGPINVDGVRVGFNWSHAFNEQWTLRQRFDAALNEQVIGPVLITSPPDSTTCTRTQCPLARFILQRAPETQSYYPSLDLTGKFDTWGIGHTLLLGGDYLRLDSLDPFKANFSELSFIDLFNPVHTGLPLALLDRADFVVETDLTEDWYGFYVQDQVKLPYNLHVLAGFRYDNAGRTTTDNNTIVPGSTFREDAVTPRFGLLWQPLPQLSLYGNYVEGFLLSNGRDPSGTPLPPETAQQWEGGLKTELFDGRLSATLAWFDLTKQNVLAAHPDPLLAAQGFSVVTGEVRNQGLEFDVSGEIWPEVRLIGSYAYIDSEITKDRQPIFSDDFTEVIGFSTGNQGHRLFGVPRHGGSLWTTFEPQGGPWQGLALGAGVVVRSQAEGDNENSFQLPGFATLNLMAGYTRKVGPSKVSLQLNVDNLLDHEYFESIEPSRSNIVPGIPRTFLGSVRVEF